MSDSTCPYIFQRGLKKNQRCNCKLRDGSKFCAKHIIIKANRSTPQVQPEKPEQPKYDIVNELEPQKEEKNEDDIFFHTEKVPKDVEVITLKPFDETKMNPTSSSDNNDLQTDSPPPEYEDENDEDVIAEKKINLYYKGISRLHKELPLNKRGGSTAREWLARVESYLGSEGIDNYFGLCFNITTKVIEKLGCALGGRINGFSDTICSMERTKDLLCMIRVKHMDVLSEIPPEYELMGMMGMTLMTLNKMNREIEAEKLQPTKSQSTKSQPTNQNDTIQNFYERNAPIMPKSN